jgi:hypothetical protein
MKKIFLLLLITGSVAYSQNKCLIYFKDKGTDSNNSLSKNSTVYNNAVNALTAHAIARREKVMGKGSFVTYEDLPLSLNYVNNLKLLGIKIENQLKWFNAVSAYLTIDQEIQISKLPFVKNVEAVRILKFTPEKTFSNSLAKLNSGPSLAEYGDAYGQLKLSDVPIVHSKGITGEGIIIGILDNGFIWRQHESLVNKKVIAEYNFVFHDSSTAPHPDDAAESALHGTKVFSIIGGFKDSSMIGAAYNASFILAKTEDDRSESKIEEDNYAAALEWMEGLGADVTTSSLGYNLFDTASTNYSYKDMDGKTTISAKAVEFAFQRGVLTFNSAGNEGSNSWHYIVTPADGLHMIAVGAVDGGNNMADFSSRGPTSDGRIKPDVVAQGVSDYGANVAGGFKSYDFGNGTSFAAPIAGGVGALLLSAYPYLTNAQARNIILETSGNAATPDNDRGYGLISAQKAISYPNLSDTSGNFRINKIFFSANPISNAFFNYSLDSASYTTQSLTYDGQLKFNFVVPQLASGHWFYFYFTYTDNSGGSFREPLTGSYAFQYGQTNISTSTITGVIEQNPGSLPAKYSLSQNYPNPFNPGTSFSYAIPVSGNVSIKIYNILGQEVAKVFQGFQKSGTYTVNFNASKLSSGVYFYRLQSGQFSETKKMILMK